MAIVMALDLGRAKEGSEMVTSFYLFLLVFFPFPIKLFFPALCLELSALQFEKVMATGEGKKIIKEVSVSS